MLVVECRTVWDNLDCVGHGKFKCPSYIRQAPRYPQIHNRVRYLIGHVDMLFFDFTSLLLSSMHQIIAFHCLVILHSTRESPVAFLPTVVTIEGISHHGKANAAQCCYKKRINRAPICRHRQLPSDTAAIVLARRRPCCMRAAKRRCNGHQSVCQRLLLRLSYTVNLGLHTQITQFHAHAVFGFIYMDVLG